MLVIEGQVALLIELELDGYQESQPLRKATLPVGLFETEFG